jgi:hypothetical protein
MSFVLALALVLGPAGKKEEWSPAKPPPPTAWARAGARPWRACDDLGRKALAVRLGAMPRSSVTENLWRRRAAQCPGEPEVLMLAAQEQIVDAAGIGWLPDAGTDLDEIVERHQNRIGRAVRWLDAAVVESSRRGVDAPLEAWYWRAYARAAMGDFPRAGDDLERAAEVGDVARWRLERMGSVVSLLEGNLQQALRRAHLSTVDAPQDDKLISRYIFALVLDRAGAPASARAEFRRIRHEPTHNEARGAVESFLPIHERLYLRALEHQANAERTNAVRLWDLYLARPEPDEPDRELARRHKAELSLVNPARTE